MLCFTLQSRLWEHSMGGAVYHYSLTFYALLCWTPTCDRIRHPILFNSGVVKILVCPLRYKQNKHVSQE